MVEHAADDKTRDPELAQAGGHGPAQVVYPPWLPAPLPLGKEMVEPCLDL